MYYTLHKNGCWDICGEAVCLRNVYPAINGRPLSAYRRAMIFFSTSLRRAV